MADTYEQNLGQKSSLTTSDFIRVVGSDNVSYKQSVSNVKEVLVGQIIPKQSERISTFPTVPNTDIDYMVASADSTFPVANGRLIIRRTANDASKVAIFIDNASANKVYLRNCSNGTWGSWVQIPTRAEIDSLNSKIEIVTYTDLAISNGYVAISYPSGFSLSDTVIVQPNYTGNSILGWSATVQQQSSNIILYIRQGTTTPANNTKVTFTAVFIKNS